MGALRRLDKVKDASWEYIACTQWAARTQAASAVCGCQSGLERTGFWICCLYIGHQNML